MYGSVIRYSSTLIILQHTCPMYTYYIILHVAECNAATIDATSCLAIPGTDIFSDAYMPLGTPLTTHTIFSHAYNQRFTHFYQMVHISPPFLI